MKGWIKASGAGGAALVQQVLRALFAFAWQTFAERVAEAVAWPGSGAQLVQARAQVPPGHAAPTQVPPPLSPPILNWLTCTLMTFQEDLFYLCCASAGKALNKYFAYFLMTMNGINHAPGIVLQLMFTF